jgi:hypothetical protein
MLSCVTSWAICSLTTTPSIQRRTIDVRNRERMIDNNIQDEQLYDAYTSTIDEISEPLQQNMEKAQDD